MQIKPGLLAILLATGTIGPIGGCAAAHAQAPETSAPALPETGSVVEAIEQLKPGQFLWAPEIAPEGPILLVVSVPRQRAILYRNGVPIGVTTVSTGKPGHDTPTGMFTVLQKQVEHHSNLYDNAPMPYMQRLTWGGVALHGGNLPGYPASHGCIRVPPAFARLLYGVTRLGMTVIVADAAAMPRLAPTANPLGQDAAALEAPAGTWTWQPDLAPTGPVSVIISAADRSIVVLRNGREIGRAPVAIAGSAVDSTTAYVLVAADATGPRWVSVGLPGQSGGAPLAPGFWQRFGIDPAFRSAVANVTVPGTTVLLTSDSLIAGSSGQPVTVIEADAPKR